MTALLEVADVRKYFPVGRRRLFGGAPPSLRAVDGVSLEVERGETLGLVGETGCGKSTLARCMTRLYDLTSGTVMFDGNDISTLSRADLRPLRREMQVMFQDPYGSLNPRRRVGSIIGDPFAIHGVAEGDERKNKVQDLMELVGLNPEHYNRFPAEFSGGQRQRIGIARALALKPKLVVCDEPVSALDVSIQAQIINLLAELQEQLGLTYMFISHDLSVVRHVSNRIAVMYLGKIVEIAEVDGLHEHTRHPYTRALLRRRPPRTPMRSRAGSGSCCAAICPRPPRPRRAAGSTRAAPRPRTAAAPRTPSWFPVSATARPTGWHAISRWRTASCWPARGPRSTTSTQTCPSTRPPPRKGPRRDR